MTTVLSQLRQALIQRTPGHWRNGGSTHRCVALSTEHRGTFSAMGRDRRGYPIGEFQHGSDNWSVCWLMAHAGDLVRLAEIVSTFNPATGWTIEEDDELVEIGKRLNADVADPEAWPL